MGLNTENASAVVAGAQPTAVAGMIRVEVLISTHINSVGRDVVVGEIVEVSQDDYRFLKPYKYVKDVVEGEVEEVVEADPAGEADQAGEADPAGTEANAPVVVEGKRANRRN